MVCLIICGLCAQPFRPLWLVACQCLGMSAGTVWWLLTRCGCLVTLYGCLVTLYGCLVTVYGGFCHWLSVPSVCTVNSAPVGPTVWLSVPSVPSLPPPTRLIVSALCMQSRQYPSGPLSDWLSEPSVSSLPSYRLVASALCTYNRQ